MATANADFATSLAALTFDLVEDELIDNITDNQVLLWDMDRRGYRDDRLGGLQIDYLVELGENLSALPYANGAILPLTTQNNQTRARYDWKFYAVPSVITGPTKFMNSGDRTQIYSLVEAIVDNAKRSLKLRVNSDLFGDGADGISLVGLAAAVENGAAWSTYGGINSGGASAQEQRWRNGWKGTVGSFAANGRRKLTELINDVTKRGEYPDLIITTQAIHQELELSMTVNEKYEMSQMKDEDMARAGFKHLVFKGIPALWDTDCTSGAAYVLNSSGLRWIVGKGKDFVDTDFQRPDNQDSMSKHTLLYCALGTKARYREGVADGITTP